jgi:hypothetical protein
MADGKTTQCQQAAIEAIAVARGLPRWRQYVALNVNQWKAYPRYRTRFDGILDEDTLFATTTALGAVAQEVHAQCGGAANPQTIRPRALRTRSSITADRRVTIRREFACSAWRRRPRSYCREKGERACADAAFREHADRAPPFIEIAGVATHREVHPVAEIATTETTSLRPPRDRRDERDRE